MDAFDLDIEEGFDVDLELAVVLYPFGQFAFVLELDGAPTVLEVGVGDEVLELAELVEVEDPLVAVYFVGV